eukprot:12906191-Prorocentrum_lima.AAC.1
MARMAHPPRPNTTSISQHRELSSQKARGPSSSEGKVRTKPPAWSASTIGAQCGSSSHLLLGKSGKAQDTTSAQDT